MARIVNTSSYFWRAYECAHEPVKPCLRALLDRFATKRDAWPACSVMHPPREVSFLVVFVTIAGGDDYDDIDGGDAQHANDKGMQRSCMPFRFVIFAA